MLEDEEGPEDDDGDEADVEGVLVSCLLEPLPFTFALALAMAAKATAAAAFSFISLCCLRICCLRARLRL